MSRYLEFFEGDILPGYVNKSDDIHTIQYGNIAAFVQLLNDEFGNFELTGIENAFLLSPAETIYDQINTNGSLEFKNISTDYHRQPIYIEKTSIIKIILYMRNQGSETAPITIEVRQPPFENSEGEIYATSTANVTPGTDGEVEFAMDVHHLPSGEYYLIVKRNDSDNEEILVRFDDTGSYSNGLATSEDNYEYDEIGGDLWFKTVYGNERTFDIVSSIAVVNGVKLMNLDTHVTIPPASAYANRIDYICLSEQGILEVLEGTASNRPSPPDDKVSESYLKIAQIKVYKGKSNAEEMKVTQDDTLGEYRTRSLLERVRRLEKHAKYVDDHYSPERAKYDVEPPVMYEGADGSYNVVWDGTEEVFKLSEENSMALTWNFKNDSNLDLNNTSQVNHSNHTAGEVTLAQTTVIRQVQSATRASPGPNTNQANYGANILPQTYGNNAGISTYPGVLTYIPVSGYLHSIMLGEHIFENVASMGMWFFRKNGMIPLQQGTSVNIGGGSKYITLFNRTFQHYGGDNNWGWRSYFPDTLWVTPGWYAIVAFPTPLNASKPAVVHNATWHDKGWPTNYANFSHFAQFTGRYPFNPNNISLANQVNTLEYGVELKKAIYLTSGQIQSSSINAHVGIKSVTMDMNIDLPSGTSYKLEVSNDGGNHFYEMQGKVHNFAQTGGKEFIWRLKLYSSNEDHSPILKYLSANGYALKAEIALDQGSVLKGCLVTTPFDGYEIAKELLTMGEPKFSRWEWVRLWANGPRTKEEEEELGIKMRVNIEVSDDGTEWQKTKTDMSLEDFYNGSVDFSYYEGSYDEDEYNYWADTDQEIQSGTVLIEPFNVTRFITNQVDNVSVSTSNGENIVSIQDTAEPGLLCHMNGSWDFSEYNQLELILSSEDYIEFGEMELILFSNTNYGLSGQVLPPVLGRYSLPFVENDGDNQRVIFTLDNPEDLAAVKSIAISINYNPAQSSFSIDNLNGLKTNKYPFFERYLRLRICMERPLTGTVSPTIRKVGVIPIFS